ncbi:hypothetical protein ABZ565_05105 [Streptomyces sp. NPDC016469]
MTTDDSPRTSRTASAVTTSSGARCAGSRLVVPGYSRQPGASKP